MARSASRATATQETHHPKQTTINDMSGFMEAHAAEYTERRFDEFHQ